MAFKLRNPFTPKPVEEASPQLTEQEAFNGQDNESDGSAAADRMKAGLDTAGEEGLRKDITVNLRGSVREDVGGGTDERSRPNISFDPRGSGSNNAEAGDAEPGDAPGMEEGKVKWVVGPDALKEQEGPGGATEMEKGTVKFFNEKETGPGGGDAPETGPIRIDHTPARLSTNTTIERQQQQTPAQTADVDDDGAEKTRLSGGIDGKNNNRDSAPDGREAGRQADTGLDDEGARGITVKTAEFKRASEPEGPSDDSSAGSQDAFVKPNGERTPGHSADADSGGGAAEAKNSMQGNTGTKAADDGTTRAADDGSGMTRGSSPSVSDETGKEGSAETEAIAGNDDGLEERAFNPKEYEIQRQADAVGGGGGAGDEGDRGFTVQATQGSREGVNPGDQSRFAKVEMDDEASESGSGMAAGKAVGEKDHGTQIDEDAGAPADAERMSGKISLVREEGHGTSEPNSDSLAVSADGGPRGAAAREQKKWLTSNFREDDPDDDEPSMLLDLSGSADDDGVIAVADLDLVDQPNESNVGPDDDVDIDDDMDAAKFDLDQTMVDN